MTQVCFAALSSYVLFRLMSQYFVSIEFLVNTASRMETNSASNRILCSERSHMLLQDQAPGIHTKRRGKIQVKGKGEMFVYWVGDDLLTPRKGLNEKTVEFNIPDKLECFPCDTVKKPSSDDKVPSDDVVDSSTILAASAKVDKTVSAPLEPVLKNRIDLPGAHELLA